MIDRKSLHAKLEDMCSCYIESDYFRELSRMTAGGDLQEAALKWLALAVLHGIESGAEEIEISFKDGETKATAEYRKARLPAPSPEVLRKALEVLRGALHMEQDKEKIPFVLGLRDDSVELCVEAKRKEDREKITLKFPNVKED